MRGGRGALGAALSLACMNDVRSLINCCFGGVWPLCPPPPLPPNKMDDFGFQQESDDDFSGCCAGTVKLKAQRIKVLWIGGAVPDTDHYDCM